MIMVRVIMIRIIINIIENLNNNNKSRNIDKNMILNVDDESRVYDKSSDETDFNVESIVVVRVKFLKEIVLGMVEVM